MRIEVKKPTPQELASFDFKGWSPWECPVSEFDWTYDERETALIHAGRVVVSSEEEKVEITAGDLVVFPAGLSCHWQVLEPVRKVYKFG